MPRQKDLKRLVRARMRKTGEAYTAARARIVAKRRRAAPRPAAAAVAGAAARTAKPAGPATTKPGPDEYAALAGMSDAVIKEKTGCTWERWVHTLDYHKAYDMPHRDIAALVKSKYKVGNWWTQSVAVGYERIKGLRAIGQRRDGTYETNKSRTYDVPVTKLYEAWADAGLRRRWLTEDGVKIRTETEHKAMRLGWPDGTVVVVGFTAKGKSKSAVALGHQKLPDKAASDRLKTYWSERLDALGDTLRASQ